MRLILGVDEAGYGPNMGPLVVAVSAWALDSDLNILEGLAPFEPEFQASPWNPLSDFVPLGDSKKIYQPSKGMSGLNFSVQFFESILENRSMVRPWFDFSNLATQDIDRVESLHWYNPSLKSIDDRTRDVLSESSNLFAREKLAKLKLRLIDFRLRILDEAFFNESIHQLGNKSDVLGQVSLSLAWQVLSNNVLAYPFQRIEMYCDKQGGRKRYSPLLSHTYRSPDPKESVPFITIKGESADSSDYELRYQGIPATIRFQVSGDSLFAPAASSIVAKWTRESLMQRLNRYWRSLVGETLRPTAGYAVDAARFAQEIAPWLTKLSIEKNRWWRER